MKPYWPRLPRRLPVTDAALRTRGSVLQGSPCRAHVTSCLRKPTSARPRSPAGLSATNSNHGRPATDGPSEETEARNMVPVLTEFQGMAPATRNARPTLAWDAFLLDGFLTKRFDAKVCSRLPCESDDVDRLNSLPSARTHRLCADTTTYPPYTPTQHTARDGGTISTNHGALTAKDDRDALIIGERSYAAVLIQRPSPGPMRFAP
jgi:hypothetical protein